MTASCADRTRLACQTSHAPADTAAQALIDAGNSIIDTAKADGIARATLYRHLVTPIVRWSCDAGLVESQACKFREEVSRMSEFRSLSGASRPPTYAEREMQRQFSEAGVADVYLDPEETPGTWWQVAALLTDECLLGNQALNPSCWNEWLKEMRFRRGWAKPNKEPHAAYNEVVTAGWLYSAGGVEHCPVSVRLEAIETMIDVATPRDEFEERLNECSAVSVPAFGCRGAGSFRSSPSTFTRRSSSRRCCSFTTRGSSRSTSCTARALTATSSATRPVPSPRRRQQSRRCSAFASARAVATSGRSARGRATTVWFQRASRRRR